MTGLGYRTLTALHEELIRRGYLVYSSGPPWKVPPDLLDLYREQYPDLGSKNAADDEPEAASA